MLCLIRSGGTCGDQRRLRAGCDCDDTGWRPHSVREHAVRSESTAAHRAVLLHPSASRRPHTRYMCCRTDSLMNTSAIPKLSHWNRRFPFTNIYYIRVINFILIKVTAGIEEWKCVIFFFPLHVSVFLLRHFAHSSSSGYGVSRSSKAPSANLKRFQSILNYCKCIQSGARPGVL